MTIDEIINKMIDEMPFSFSEQLRPYIKEAMTIYAQQEVKNKNIPDVIEQLSSDEDREFTGL
jgi:hypothetical protein